MCLYLDVSKIHANVTDGLIQKKCIAARAETFVLPIAISVQSRY